MKYLARDTNTKVIELVFLTPITPSPPLEMIEVQDDDFRQDMLKSIFNNVNDYKVFPHWGESGVWHTAINGDWVDTRTDAKVWEMVREVRNNELSQSDWTQLADSPLTPPEQAQWTAYRAQLRDVPQNNPVPRNAEQAISTIQDNKPAT